ncbi:MULTISPECIES: hypothetical protein [Pseudomonas]|uniref:Uncharacterized protein n=1 Tax=Pseudomonas sichuanensis TaxID=2213015 RepID=A0ABV0DJG4_9PSED
MPLTKPNQELHEDLDGHAASLDWAAHDLLLIAKRIEEAGLADDAKALNKIGKDLKEWREIVLTISDEVEDELIVRSEP